MRLHVQSHHFGGTLTLNPKPRQSMMLIIRLPRRQMTTTMLYSPEFSLVTLVGGNSLLWVIELLW